MADVDIERLRGLAENAEKWRSDMQTGFSEATDKKVKAGKLNDYFYWAGKATAYRGIIAMIELQGIVEEEVDAEPSCP